MDLPVDAAATALWLGILTSISPCPLATNIAAISYIGRRLGSPRKVFLSGLLYALGRTLVYLALGVLLVAGALSIPRVSHLLQRHINQFLGPILILVGMVLLELLQLPVGGSGVSAGTQRRAERLGVWGAGLLGVVFALSFCPISAGLFFLGLVPLSVKHGSPVVFPSLYGIGTALPVIAFAILIALGTRAVGLAFNKLTQFEWWARRITGVIFIAVGIYYCLTCIFGVGAGGQAAR